MGNGQMGIAQIVDIFFDIAKNEIKTCTPLTGNAHWPHMKTTHFKKGLPSLTFLIDKKKFH